MLSRGFSGCIEINMLCEYGVSHIQLHSLRWHWDYTVTLGNCASSCVLTDILVNPDMFIRICLSSLPLSIISSSKRSLIFVIRYCTATHSFSFYWGQRRVLPGRWINICFYLCELSTWKSIIRRLSTNLTFRYFSSKFTSPYRSLIMCSLYSSLFTGHRSHTSSIITADWVLSDNLYY